MSEEKFERERESLTDEGEKGVSLSARTMTRSVPEVAVKMGLAARREVPNAACITC